MIIGPPWVVAGVLLRGGITFVYLLMIIAVVAYALSYPVEFVRSRLRRGADASGSHASDFQVEKDG